MVTQCAGTAAATSGSCSAPIALAWRNRSISFPSSMLPRFVRAGGQGQCGRLRWVICSGEALRGWVVGRFAGRFGAGLHNLYGPTEASVDVTAWACDGGSDVQAIGVPVANTRVFVLDEWLCPVPAGVAGGLYISGGQLARGYLGRG